MIDERRAGRRPRSCARFASRASVAPRSREQVATPGPGPGEALVRVHAAALTRDELEWPVDRLPAIPSYELSGVVAALGPGVDGVAVGDEVFGMTAFRPRRCRRRLRRHPDRAARAQSRAR